MCRWQVLSAANMRCDRGGRGHGNDASRVVVFYSNCDGALPGLGVLRKQHTLHISIVNIAQTGPQRNGTLASDLKRTEARAPAPSCARHCYHVHPVRARRLRRRLTLTINTQRTYILALEYTDQVGYMKMKKGQGFLL